MADKEEEGKPEPSEYGDASEPQRNETPDSELPQLGPNYSHDPQTKELVYTDPSSQRQYVLNADKTDWVPKAEYDFDGTTYRYTNENGTTHVWDVDKQVWTKQEAEEESEEDDNTTEEDRKKRQYRKRKAQPGWGTSGEYTKDPETGVQLYKDAKDGMVYEWDAEKKAWFPRINDDFMAQYQMNYGFDNEGAPKPTQPEAPAAPDKAEQKEKKDDISKKPRWFEDDSMTSTKVYVTGLPLDFTEEKLLELMSKCGVVETDVRTNTQKLKLYRDANGVLKGDALCTYMKPESVELALTILDGSRIGDSKTPISVERAKFEMKGAAYNPKLKPRKLGKKEQERLKKKKEKLLAWEPDRIRGERNKRDKVIVIENVFDPRDFDVDPAKILECSSRLREYCCKFGSVRKVVVYDKHKNGICQVFFATPEEGDVAISMLDGRLYGDKRVLKAYTWDGKTKYKISETEEEERQRLAKWDEFLQVEEEDAPTMEKG